MWFLGSWLTLFGLAILTISVGWCVLQLVYSYQKNCHSPENLAACAVIGTGVLMLLTGYFSYIGLPCQQSGPLIVFIAVLVYLWTLKKTQLYRLGTKKILLHRPHDWQLIAALFICSFLALISLYLYNSYNPYYDTIYYFGISDYLLDHSIWDIANPAPYSPILFLSKVSQLSCFRMGINFFSSFALSIMPAQRSYEIYPCVAAWFMLLNVFAVYLGCRWIIKVSRFFAGIGALLVIVPINAIHFSNLGGFFHQQAGTAFFVFALAILAKFLRIHNKNHNDIRLIFLLALACAFIISGYNELFPFFALTIFVCFFWKIGSSTNQMKHYLKLSFMLILLTGLIANIEIYHMLINLFAMLNVVVGFHIHFTLFQYIGMALGIQSNVLGPLPDTDLMLTLYSYAGLITIIFFVLFLLGIYQQVRRKNYVCLVAIIIFLLAIFYYLCFAIDPWTLQHGHTWSLFKLIAWMYPLNVICITAGMSLIACQKKIWQFFIILLIIGFMPMHFNTLKKNADFISALTFSQHPFTAYEQLSEMVNQIEPEKPVEIAEDASEWQKRILPYFLYPHPVIANYAKFYGESEKYPDIPHLVLSSRTESDTLANANHFMLPGGFWGAIKNNGSIDIDVNVDYSMKNTLAFMQLVEFSTPEADGIWTNGFSPSITLFIEESTLIQHSEGSINFYVSPAIYPGLASQDVKIVWGNNRHMASQIAITQSICLSYTFTDWIDVPNDPSRKKILIQFQLPNAMAPVKVNPQSSDARFIGLRFHTFSLVSK